VYLLNKVLDGFEGPRTGLHICRGNWSRAESTLLSGSYRPLAPYLEQINVDQLVLEYATERAGDLMPMAGKEIGFGCVNPRTDTIETPDEIVARVTEARQFFAPDAIFLNPDCGFCTFASRPMNAADVAFRKLESMVEAARRLRDA
jgi:5-methyltetrahydropteroyltriglutamate--homocysteine methyltransferase